jgi:hypothetical protein
MYRRHYVRATQDSLRAFEPCVDLACCSQHKQRQSDPPKNQIHSLGSRDFLIFDSREPAHLASIGANTKRRTVPEKQDDADEVHEQTDDVQTGSAHVISHRVIGGTLCAIRDSFHKVSNHFGLRMVVGQSTGGAEGRVVAHFRDLPVLLTRPSRAPTPSAREPVAQMVEHLTFNQVVLGSSPSGLTIEMTT